jgi:uncharacterized membrane protein YczE
MFPSIGQQCCWPILPSPSRQTPPLFYFAHFVSSLLVAHLFAQLAQQLALQQLLWQFVVALFLEQVVVFLQFQSQLLSDYWYCVLKRLFVTTSQRMQYM